MQIPAINPEQLAYWYFRLNGFMTTVNFVVHPEEGSEQRTDVDVLGVRFPYRAELLTEPMVDDPLFTTQTDRPFVVIAEVKKRGCKLNGPWTRPEDRNMHRVLTATGAIRAQDQDSAAKALYEFGAFKSEQVFISLCCVGGRENREITNKFPGVPQILWPHVASFIHNRFKKYSCAKLSHPQWDQTGQALWKLFVDSRSVEDYVEILQSAVSQSA